MILNKYVEEDKIIGDYKLSSYSEIKNLEKYIDMIILDSPGLCYLVLKEIVDINKIFSLYSKIKEKHSVYNTPILFFTRNIFQMLICSNFNNKPFEYYKISDIEEKYRNRKIYLNYEYECFYNNKEVMKQVVLTALSQVSIQINEIDITEDFQNIKSDLFTNLLQILQFYLCLKNSTILEENSCSNIIDTYKNYSNNANDLQNVLSVFENDNVLSSETKTKKIITFIKEIQRELIKDYE
jgi:hypothetical protein